MLFVFPRGVLNEILKLIESVSEGFPSYFCPKAALLFWFFGDFRYGALLFMVIHVIYKYKNR